MKRSLLTNTGLGALLIFIGGGAAPALAQSDANPALQDVIIVTGAKSSTSTLDVEKPGLHPFEGPDATMLLTRIPGGARVSNGALSGQAQYQGLFGPRLNVRVDSQAIAAACPNLMDPPLHFAPLPLVSSLEIDRGVSPVRDGPGLGGGVNAVLKRVDFSEGSTFSPHYDLTAQGRTVDDSYAVGGVAGISNDSLRFNILGSREEGGDTDYPDGKIASSSFERSVYGASAGYKTGAHEVGFDLRRQETGPTGNPPFPMDIIYVDTNLARGTYKGSFGEFGLEASAAYTGSNHLMSNFNLRPAPAAAMQRETHATAKTYEGRLALSYPVSGGLLRIGGDLQKDEHDVTISNPNNVDFYIATLSGYDYRRLGAFAEWTGALGLFNSEVGVRVDDHRQETGAAATGSAVPSGAAMLAAAFNAADRTRTDTTVDAAARFWTAPKGGVSWRLTLARKTRVPGYVERYGWLPSNAAAGLADGNIYVGDLNLKPEAAWVAEAGFDYASERAYFRPTVYYKRVDDYIQGVPFDATPGVADTPQEMVAAMSGDTTPLRFANVDAKLYGADFDAGLALDEHWRVDVVGSYVRGERRDIDDNLYRIAPPNLTAGLTYEAAIWSATFESRLIARQNKVSATNSEAPTDGYAVFNLYGDVTIAEGVKLSAGVENLFNELYEDHLAGYNRISGSDVAVGERLPGSGRGAFLRLSIAK